MSQKISLQGRFPVGSLAVVVGLGSSGRAAARLLVAMGLRVRVVDQKEAPLPDDLAPLQATGQLEAVYGPHSAAQFAGACLAVVSPGVRMADVTPHAAKAGVPCEGELALALPFVDAPILAITGTSGKTTTASLAAAMLEGSGKNVFLGGNIGTPLSEYVLAGGGADVLVLEVSSFQLQGAPQFHPHVAVLLNLAPNHLDYHASMAEYEDAKFAMFSQQTAADFAVLAPELEPEWRTRGNTAQMALVGAGEEFGQMQLLGEHNRYNAAAAALACQPFGVTQAQAVAAANAFAPLEHRLEIVCEPGGVLYVNDSKSTTVDSLRVALQSVERPIILLAGGKFKGGDLGSLRPLLQQRVKHVALYGGSREAFEQAFAGAAPVSWQQTMSEAMETARSLAVQGDVVLLSPATASYDQYVHYMARGAAFRSLARGE